MKKLLLLRFFLLQHRCSVLFKVVVKGGILASHLNKLLEDELLLRVDSNLVLVGQLLERLNPPLRHHGLLRDLI